MLPRLKALEDVKYVLVLRVVRLARAHERAVPQAVVLEQPLVLLRDAERLQTALVLELEARLGGPVLDGAEDLNEELRVLDDAAIPTDGLIANVGAAHFALVLNLNELDVSDEAEDFDHVPDDLVRGDRLDQLDLIVGLEVGHLVLHLPDDLEVGHAEHELHIDVDGVGDLAHGILDEQDHAAPQVGFQVDAAVMLDEERHLALVICALQVNVTRHKVRTATPRIVLQALVDLVIS